MTSVNEAFETFRQRLELSDTESKNASKRHNEVRDCIRAKFSVDRDFLTGSYDRHTKTKPLTEELAFRGWLRKGAPLAAVASLLAYIAWHPLQTLLQLPFGRPEFLDPRFLSLIAWLGLACTLSRIRSGSIWPAVIIHWGIVVVWKALYAG